MIISTTTVWYPIIYYISVFRPIIFGASAAATVLAIMICVAGVVLRRRMKSPMSSRSTLSEVGLYALYDNVIRHISYIRFINNVISNHLAIVTCPMQYKRRRNIDFIIRRFDQGPRSYFGAMVSQ